MMFRNRWLFAAMSLAIVFTALCCSSKDSADEQEGVSENDEEYKEWPIMDEFHMVMAESYHPYADSGNLEPAKANAAEMALLASRWANSEMPSQLDSGRLKGYLNELASVTQQLEQNTGNEEELEVLLSKSHQIFHEVMEGWHSGTWKIHPDEQEEGE